jgi:hypothetical protein
VIPEYLKGVTLAPADDAVERATRHRAVRCVCANALSAEDADYTLEVLGLDPREGRTDALLAQQPVKESGAR